jgi:hypothetical protein
MQKMQHNQRIILQQCLEIVADQFKFSKKNMSNLSKPIFKRDISDEHVQADYFFLYVKMFFKYDECEVITFLTSNKYRYTTSK